MAQSFNETDGLRLKKLLFVLVLLIFIPAANAAAPTITSYNNSESGNTLYPHINVNDNINFAVVSNQTITAWTWLIDNVSVSNNYDNYTKSWLTPGNKKVAVNGSNANGSTQVITWLPLVMREKSEAADVSTELDTSGYTNLTDSISGANIDYRNFLVAVISPFTSVLGNLFYVFLYGLPLIVIWIRQEKAIIPAVISIILGGFFIGQLPESFVSPAILFVILTTFGIIYSLVKERG